MLVNVALRKHIKKSLWSAVAVCTFMWTFFFPSFHIYLREREREREREHVPSRGRAEDEGESKQTPALSTEPDTGLNTMILRSLPQPKPRVRL